MRGEAALALGQLHDARAVEPLIGALHDKDASVRHAAAQALRAVGVPTVAAAVRADQCAVPALAALAADDTQQEDLRILAAYALAEVGDSRGVPVLLSALDHRPDMYTGWAVS